ncbi:MAG: hypothetical protein Q4C30_07090 [Bacteroidia bacterium]|nr:hypothetical protein [Bacteroidia bacterium]
MFRTITNAIKNIFSDQLKGLDVSHRDKFNVRCLCYFTAGSDFFAALSCPVTDKWTYSCPEISSQLISMSNVFWGIAVIVICKLWYKGSPVRNFIWRYREWLNIGYLASTTGCVIWMFIDPNPYLLYIINAMIFWFIFASWFSRILDFTKAKIFNVPELRNSYDTMREMYGSIASTSGYFIGSLVSDGIPLKVAFICWQAGVTLNVLGRGIVFAKNRKKLSQEEEEAPACTDEIDIPTLLQENERLKEELAAIKNNKQ